VTILGPNGMGKSTLLGVMAGVLSPQRGSVLIDGLRRRGSEEEELEIRKRSVYLPDQPWLPANRTAASSSWPSPALRCRRRTADRPCRSLLELFDLAEKGIARSGPTPPARRKDRPLSALAAEVPILLLDEPFSGGLDPSGILTLKRIIQHHARRKDSTVVLTSPVPS